MRRRVLMVKLTLQPPGGGQGVAAWMLEALKGQCTLGVLTEEPVDLAAINRFYGTSLSLADLSFVGIASRWHHLLRRLPYRADLLRYALLMQAGRRLASEWDVLLSVDYEVDFGRPAIQYINVPIFQRPLQYRDVSWQHGPRVVVDTYRKFCDAISRMTAEGIRANRTLSVSDYIGAQLRTRHGIEARTLYPPVIGPFAPVPWEQRRNAFLCLGRVSPEKRLERVIAIVAAVRQAHPGVSLCLAGTFGRDAYGRRIRQLVAQHQDWISVAESLTREQVVELIPQFRYGIHGMLDEHFGMAPAEMVSAGCIVFVPDDGGQVEIVGPDTGLTYSSVDTAVARITEVLANPAEQERLRAVLASRAGLFTPERFADDVREVVNSFPG